MTSESAQPFDAPAFQPLEPETGLPTSSTPVIPTGPTAPTRRTRAVVNGVLAVAFIVLVGGVAFAIGRATAPATITAGGNANPGVLDGGFRPANGDQVPGGFGDDGDGRLGPGLGSMTVRGTVKAVDADSITVQLSNGTTVEIALDSATAYHRQSDATASDVATGSTVVVGLTGQRASGATATDVTVVP